LKAVEGQLLNNVYIVGENGAHLGRHSASNDIVISESFVSRRHCEIKCFDGGKFHLKDIGSTTGTFLMVRNEVKLKDQMMFQMGLSEFKVVATSKKSLIELHVFEGPARTRIIPIDTLGTGIGRDI
jgi:pSer/pThr/pTyr-binding forkhead associated (FHA) protein